MVDKALDGQCVVLTGATRGIGKATALRFAEEGARIVAVARNADDLDTLARELGDAMAASVAGDVGDEAIAEQALRACLPLGGCDILVNTAGIFPAARLADIKTAEAEAIIRTNFFGVFNFCRTIVPHMVQRSSGAVVNVSSIAARTPTPGISVYAASKAAVESFSRSIAAEVAPTVRVNCLAPGPTMTEAVAKLAAEDTTGAVDGVATGLPMGRYGEPDEVADGILFLARSKASRWMTGQTVQVNGGGFMA
ncbi:MAG: SDR family oxidoreductase [Caenibius sp.]